MIARQEIHRIESRLDSVLERGQGVDVSDTERRADYAKYFCVLVSGLIEKAAYLALLDYTERGSSPKIRNYVECHLSRFWSANTWKLAELFGRFDSGWADAIENGLADEEKEAINSVVANRHQIAHGVHVGLSLGRVQQYYQHVKKAINHMMTICGCK